MRRAGGVSGAGSSSVFTETLQMRRPCSSVRFSFSVLSSLTVFGVGCLLEGVEGGAGT